MAKLVVTERGEQRTLEIGSSDLIEVGRDETCAIQIADPLSSRKHCRILGTLNGFELVDLGSSNGTVHNGMRVERVPLTAGDRIQIGEVKIEFIAEPTSEAPTGPLERVEPVIEAEKPTAPAPPPKKEAPAPAAKPAAAPAAKTPAAPGRAQPHLVVVNGPLEGKKFGVETPFTIGRRDSCGLTLPDPKASGEHARIDQQAGRWILSDLDSGNGLFLGKNRISKHKLVDGDLIVIGDTRLRMRGIPADPATSDASSASQVIRAVDEGGLSEDDLSAITPRMIEEEGGLQWVGTLVFVVCLSLIVYYGNSMISGFLDPQVAVNESNLLGAAGSFEDPPEEGWGSIWKTDAQASDAAELIALTEPGLPHGKSALRIRGNGGDHDAVRLFNNRTKDFQSGDAFLVSGRVRNQGFDRVGFSLRWFARRSGELVVVDESYTELPSHGNSWTRLSSVLVPPRFGEASACEIGIIALGSGSADIDDLQLQRVEREESPPPAVKLRAGGVPVEVTLNDRGIAEVVRDDARWLRQVRLASADADGTVPWGQIHPVKFDRPSVVENGAIRNSFELSDGNAVSQVTQSVGDQIRISYTKPPTDAILVLELDPSVERLKTTVFNQERTVGQGLSWDQFGEPIGDELIIGDGADQLIFRWDRPGTLRVLDSIAGRGGRALSWRPLNPSGGTIDLFVSPVSDRERRRVDELWSQIAEKRDAGNEGESLVLLEQMRTEFPWRTDLQDQIRGVRQEIEALADQGYEELLAMREDWRTYPGTPIDRTLAERSASFASRFAGTSQASQARALTDEVGIGIGESQDAQQQRAARDILVIANRYFEGQRDLVAKIYYEWLAKDFPGTEEARTAELRINLIEARQ